MEASEKNEETHSNRTERLDGTVKWATATVYGVFAGMLYRGGKEAVVSANKDAELLVKLTFDSTLDKREKYRIIRDMLVKSFFRIARGYFVGGVQVGMSTAGFYGLQNWLAEKRGVHDVFNVIGAGSATAAAFGLIMPGSLQWRARNVVLGSVLGAAICFPLGLIQLKLVDEANEWNTDANGSRDIGEAKSGLGAAMDRLEESFEQIDPPVFR